MSAREMTAASLLRRLRAAGWRHTLERAPEGIDPETGAPEDRGVVHRWTRDGDLIEAWVTAHGTLDSIILGPSDPRKGCFRQVRMEIGGDWAGPLALFHIAVSVGVLPGLVAVVDPLNLMPQLAMAEITTTPEQLAELRRRRRGAAREPMDVTMEAPDDLSSLTGPSPRRPFRDAARDLLASANPGATEEWLNAQVDSACEGLAEGLSGGYVANGRCVLAIVGEPHGPHPYEDGTCPGFASEPRG